MSDKPTYKTHEELVAEATKNPEYRKARALCKPWSDTVIALANDNHILRTRLATLEARVAAMREALEEMAEAYKAVVLSEFETYGNPMPYDTPPYQKAMSALRRKAVGEKP